MKIVCELCPHHCRLAENQVALCRARKNLSGKIHLENYGQITSLALDPISKKPLFHFHPHSNILSVGSYGCNLHCPFCQNSSIAVSGGKDVSTQYISPEDLVQLALDLVAKNNIGIAYTYNEPLISYEYIWDCANLVRQNNLKNVLVTNGMICAEPLQKLLPYIDALNIDLKAFTEKFYKMIGGDLTTVKETIRLASKVAHVEITTLIIPDENDTDQEIENLSAWLASINHNIPLHITRFFPRWQMQNKKATPVERIYSLAEIARKNLQYVYEGNC